ncbi:MAG: PAS sensor protein, partial [uncultured Thiotrichaceae bacterium]
ELARSRAFEPFFTTKGGGENSGLGLSMVYGLVKQSKGYLRISNRNDGIGACITLLFPAVRVVQSLPVANPVQPLSNADATTPNKLFLLVEDDADVRKIIRNQLVAAGIHIIEAEDAVEAGALIDKLPGLDGMISDIMLQGKNSGWELAEKLYQKNAQSMILLISGYADKDQSSFSHDRFPLLQKPFDQQTLQQAIQRAMPGGRRNEDRQTGLCD